ncbi:MAG: FAD:protein FMN transferase [Acidobacteria bacterium]|nr:FAD:protein FMN transferase [Acidobacteriota bacterium]
MRFFTCSLIDIILALAPAVAWAPQSAHVQQGSRQPLEVQRQVYLMGTRATLATYSIDRKSGLQQLEFFIEILEKTEQELSTWRPDSVLSQLNRQPVAVPFALNASACRLFRDIFFWHQETGSLFDPAIGSLIQAWRLHEGGNLPTAEVLEEARGRAGMRYLDFAPSLCQIVRRRETTMDPGAFGKGEALDRVFNYTLRHRSGPWLIDLGGQVMVYGLPPKMASWKVDLAHPLKRRRSALAVHLTSGSVATSGGSERDLQVSGQHVSHIVDPRSGRPVKFKGSVAVWHPSAVVADILSTALYIMGPEDGLAWAEARGLSVCFFVAEDGRAGDVRVRVRASPDFARRFF